MKRQHNIFRHSLKSALVALAIFMSLTLMLGDAVAGRVTNMDDQARTLHITYVGNVTEKITLSPGESAALNGPWFALSLEDGKTINSNYEEIYIIQKNQLLLMDRIQTRSGVVR